MSYRDRILEYMAGRKRPQTADDLAKYFLISRATAYRHLMYWWNLGVLTRTSINTKTFFASKLEKGEGKNRIPHS